MRKKRQNNTNFSTACILFVSSLLLFVALVTGFTILTSQKKVETSHAASGNAAWPAFNGTGERNGTNTNETIINMNNVFSLKLLWQTSLPSTADSSIVE